MVRGEYSLSFFHMNDHGDDSKQWFRVFFRNYQLGIIDVQASSANAAYRIACEAGPHRLGLINSEDWDFECIELIDAENVERPYLRAKRH